MCTKGKSGPRGHITSAAKAGVPDALKQGTKTHTKKEAHKCAWWKHHPGCLGGSLRLQSMRTKKEVAHKCALWPHQPCRLGGVQVFKGRDQVKSGPNKGSVATSLLRLGRGSPTLPSRVQKQNERTIVPRGNMSPAVEGVPKTSERGNKTQEHRSGLHGHIALAILWGGGGEASLQNREQNQKWRTSGSSTYITPLVWWSATFHSRGHNQK